MDHALQQRRHHGRRDAFARHIRDRRHHGVAHGEDAEEVPTDFLAGLISSHRLGERGLESRHGHQALLDARRGREFLLMIALLLAGCAIVLDRLPDRFQQFFIFKRLGEKLHRAGLHRAYGRRDVGVACDENDGNLDLAS